MAYEPTIWKNREVEKPRTFTIQDNGDGTVTLIPAEGQINEPGTPIMAANMNKIEDQLVHVDEQLGYMWKKNVYNDVNLTNLSLSTAEKSWESWQEWQDATVVETLVIQIPSEHFWGSIELTLTGGYNVGNAGGGAHIIYHLGAAGGNVYVNEKTIVSISSFFAARFYVGDAVRVSSPNRFYLPISRRANTINRLSIRVKINANTLDAYQLIDNIYLQRTGQVTSNMPVQRSRADEVYDLLFQSVSNGKSLVANAITQKGVPTSPTAEFATMANNINQLRGFATGTRTVAANGALSVTGLTFEPKVVFAIIGSGDGAAHMYIEKLTAARGYIVEAYDGSNQPNQPPTEFSPVWGKRKADSNVIFTATSFSIPARSAGTYTWYAYG